MFSSRKRKTTGWSGKPKPMAVRASEPQPKVRRKPLEQQFDEKYVPEHRGHDIGGVPSACWVWTGSTNGKGAGVEYGVFSRPKMYAHRYAWERFKGPIPDGYVIDHLCRVRLCVNPDHLEPVPIAKNLKRGAHPNFRSHATGMCARGLHDLNNPDNVYLRADGRAFCRVCYNNARERRKDGQIGLGGKLNFSDARQTNPWGLVEEPGERKSK
jgi:hypothetical protein